MPSPLFTITEILKKYWGHEQFRPMQEEIILSVLEGKDTLALLPTGGGKSICFQVPALYKPGICIVISPLIALMKDQVENLEKRNIKAIAIYSGMTKEAIDIALNNAIYGDYKFLYISPERLKTHLLRERLKQMPVNLVAVDESHCISQWGYDFRPPYLEIASIRELLPGIPVLALTATATPEVVKDIQEKLQFRAENVFQKSFARPNLTYAALKTDNKPGLLIDYIHRYKGASIVYARNRKKTKTIASFIQEKDITADFYHAGLEHKDRSRKQEEWINNKTQVIVATNAFGMGIDKPDVRLVVHLDIPDSIEAYFQEAGRGGRDEKESLAIMLFNDQDIRSLQENFEKSFPAIPEIKRIYNALCDFLKIAAGSGKEETFTIDPTVLCTNFSIEPVVFFSALGFLQRIGMLSFSDYNDATSSIEILKTPDYNLLSYKEGNLMKTLLRNYEGLYDAPQKIKEKHIAIKLKCPQVQVVQLLHILHQKEWIKYQEAAAGFSITFITERLTPGNFHFPDAVYKTRKTIAQKKLAAIIALFTDENTCRNKMLLQYFGETAPKDCGKCDVCIRKSPETYSPETFRSILKTLAESGKEHFSMEAFIRLIPDQYGSREMWIKWLTDENMIRVTEDRIVILALDTIRKAL